MSKIQIIDAAVPLVGFNPVKAERLMADDRECDLCGRMGQPMAVPDVCCECWDALPADTSHDHSDLVAARRLLRLAVAALKATGTHTGTVQVIEEWLKGDEA